tara:strand:+ start:2637 stop:3224 length:588 start_codon:yes stop_codon:yes gene_type:complete
MSLEKADKAELVGSTLGITKTKPFTNFLRDCNPQATEWSLKARGHKISCKFINGVLDMPKVKPQVQYLTVLSQAQRYRLCYTLASLITTEEAVGPLYHRVMRAAFDVMVKEYKEEEKQYSTVDLDKAQECKSLKEAKKAFPHLIQPMEALFANPPKIKPKKPTPAAAPAAELVGDLTLTPKELAIIHALRAAETQ